MLDIAPGSESSPCNRMPLDFTQYLLSASPPASSFDFHSYASSSGNGFAQRFPTYTLPLDADDYKKAALSNCSLNNRRHGPLKSIIIRPETEDSGCGDMNSLLPTTPASSATSEVDTSSPTSPCSPGRLRKKVSFADAIGKPLTEVRMMRESSDEPPTIRPELLACITQGAQARVTDKPPLKLTFSQPACDYLAFRDKISKHSVSLENVLLNDYMVQGTIKVKNIGFEKKVFIRWTNDSWNTHTDIPANYVPGPGDVPGRASMFDTFQFQFEVPPTSDTTKSVQFAVCFESNGEQYWDNNFGENYGIILEKFTDPNPSILNNMNNNKSNAFIFGPHNFADFACWNHVDTSRPYY